MNPNIALYSSYPLLLRYTKIFFLKRINKIYEKKVYGVIDIIK